MIIQGLNQRKPPGGQIRTTAYFDIRLTQEKQVFCNETCPSMEATFHFAFTFPKHQMRFP